MKREREKRELVTSRPYSSGLQVVKSRRAVFGKARKRRFLDELAMTCNVTQSAAAAGVTPSCVYQARQRDPEFRADWQVALEQGYARIEAMLLERATALTPEPGEEPNPAEPIDRDLALHLLREHKKGLAGKVTREGPPPHGAAWREVEEYFTARLRALKIRLESEPGE